MNVVNGTALPAPPATGLPHNLEAERSVLGAVLIDNAVIDMATTIIGPRHFFRDAHARIFAAICALVSAGQPADLVTLKEALESRGQLEAVGGPAYIASLVDGVPRSTNVEYYAKIVWEKAEQRRSAAALSRALDQVYAGRPLAEAIAAIGAVETSGSHHQQVRHATDLMAAPPASEIVENIAWAGCITLFVGESGAGKSFVVAAIGAAVSAGTPWHGRSVARGSVLYVPFESDALGNRLRALKEIKGAPLEHFYILRGSAPLSRRGDGPADGELALIAAITALRRDLAAREAPALTLIVIDTVRASMAGNEDSSEDVSAYLRAIQRIAGAAPEAGIILTHHAGWQDGETQKKRERGSSAWRGNVDATLYLETGPYDEQRHEAEITLKTLKVRDGERPAPLKLIRRRVEIEGVDRRGNPLTSCVIERDSRTSAEREQEAIVAASQEQAALDQRTLRAIVERPELATSLDGLRTVLGVRKPLVTASIHRLVANGLVLPGRRGQPYVATVAGLALLSEVPS